MNIIVIIRLLLFERERREYLRIRAVGLQKSTQFKPHADTALLLKWPGAPTTLYHLIQSC